MRLSKEITDYNIVLIFCWFSYHIFFRAVVDPVDVQSELIFSIFGFIAKLMINYLHVKRDRVFSLVINYKVIFSVIGSAVYLFKEHQYYIYTIGQMGYVLMILLYVVGCLIIVKKGNQESDLYQEYLKFFNSIK